MVGLVGLDNGGGRIEVAAADTTEDLGEELESALGSGKIGERKPGVGLDDADGSEMRQIEAASEGLGADEDVDVAVFDVVIEAGEGVGFFVVAVEAGDFGSGEEFFKFRFEEFGAEAFVDDTGFLAVGAR